MHRLQLEPIIGVILIQFNQSEGGLRDERGRGVWSGGRAGGRVQMLVKYPELTEELLTPPHFFATHPLTHQPKTSLHTIILSHIFLPQSLDLTDYDQFYVALIDLH